MFVNDSSVAENLIVGAGDVPKGVRMARNFLGIEAVSVVDETGRVMASTSQTLLGSLISNELLVSAATTGRFSALAGAVDAEIHLDGVPTWPVNSVLYQVISPLDKMDGSILLHYDITSLLERRAGPGELQPETLGLFGIALLFLLISALVLVARGRAARRYQSLVRESDLLRGYSERLEEVNTDLALARDAAEDALALAEEKIRIRSEFVLMINHELRTPLTSVVTGAELIRATQLSESEKQSLLESMVNDGNRLVEIIDQILAVARIENWGLSKELTEVGLADFCDAIGAVFDHDPGDSQVIPRVHTDQTAMKLVVGSLIDNARIHGAKNVEVRCSTTSRVTPELEVGRHPDHPVYVVVSDDGPGIDSAFLPRIFEKFEKSSFSSGTGLGLYMARMVIEALEGSVAVSSSSTGTTFQIAIPSSPIMTPAGAKS